MNQIVSPWFLGSLLGPLEMDHDDDELMLADVNDIVQTRTIIRRLLKPYFELATLTSHANFKESLRYYLAKQRRDVFAEIFQRMQDCIIGVPDDVGQFFGILWEELFPGELVESRSVEDYMESSDFTLGLRFERTGP